MPFTSMTKTLSAPTLAFRLYRAGDSWPFTDPTMLRLPAEPDEEEVPREWIGWKGQEAVALLSTYPAGTRLCGIGLEPGDEMLFLRVAMDENGQFLFDAPTAYKFAFRHVLDDPAINRIIVELSTLNKQENEHLASIDLFPHCKIDSEPRMNYYVINRDWDANSYPL